PVSDLAGGRWKRVQTPSHARAGRWAGSVGLTLARRPGAVCSGEVASGWALRPGRGPRRDARDSVYLISNSEGSSASHGGRVFTMSRDYSGLSYEEAFPLKLLEMLQAGRDFQKRLVEERAAQEKARKGGSPASRRKPGRPSKT